MAHKRKLNPAPSARLGAAGERLADGNSWRAGKGSSANARLYGARWQQYRKQYLADHPLCRMCAAAGRISEATIVDHIEPHNGDRYLFWLVSNHAALCKPCHDSEKQRRERGGRALTL